MKRLAPKTNCLGATVNGVVDRLPRRQAPIPAKDPPEPEGPAGRVELLLLGVRLVVADAFLGEPAGLLGLQGLDLHQELAVLLRLNRGEGLRGGSPLCLDLCEPVGHPLDRLGSLP